MEQNFAEWLLQKTWRHAARFCNFLAVLVLITALAVDIPTLNDEDLRGNPLLWSQIALHVAAFVFALSVIAIDRFAARLSGRPWLVYSICAAVMALSTWQGVISWLWQGDLSIFALGSVFVATVLSTPQHVRRSMYLISVAVTLAVIYTHAKDFVSMAIAVVNPIFVGAVCLQLDRYVYERNVELFSEMQRADHERARADKVLYNVLPASIAEELKLHEKVNAVKFEGMGVMFADIVGFTAFSKTLSPDALVFVLNQIFSMFDGLVDKYNLEKIKTIGDAYMVISNKQTEALAALAFDMLEAMKAHNATNGSGLQLRIGLHVGPAVAGVIGVKRFLYDVWGDTVNVASRMESNGEAGRIHVTQAVQAQLEGKFSFEQREPIEIKGQGRMTTYFITGNVR